jgi:sugar lactone lactonase YvrE
MKRQFTRVAAGTVLVLAVLTASLPHRAAAATPPVGTLLIVAGTGPKGFSGDGGPATQAQLNTPRALAFDAAGNLFIAEWGNARVRKVTAEGIITTVAGGGKTQPRPVDGIPATQAQLGILNGGLAFDGAGDLFIGSWDRSRVWKVSPEGLITTVQSRVQPFAVAVDPAGDLFIAVPDEGRVLKMTPDGTLTPFAGIGHRGYSGDGGPAIQAQLDGPQSLAADGAGNLFIGEDNNRVRKVSPDGIITTYAGNGKPGSSGDGGPATQAQLGWPIGLAADSAGSLFIADADQYRVRKVTPDGIISTVAGTGQAQLSGVGGPATSAGLRGPMGLAVDAAGNLFIADSGWVDNRSAPSEHVLEVVGVAAPGLIAGKPFPKL